nr:pVII [Tawny frogmouth aviadenovirus A]
MSILVSPSDNRGWGYNRSMRGCGVRRRRVGAALTLRRLLGLGTVGRRRRLRGGRRPRRSASSTTTRIVAVRTTRHPRRRRR